MATADAHGLMDRDRRRKGQPIPSNDLWIAAGCLEPGPLLFRFAWHFDQVGGLRVMRRWAEALP